MSLAEIGSRSRQQGSKWIDRLRRDSRGHDAQAVLRAHARHAQDVVGSINRTFNQRFFSGADVTAVAHHRASYVAEIRQDADRLLTNRFDLLGYRDLSFGDPIDWHLDPVWLRQSPLVHWSQINALDPAVAGDSKVVWELNRHQWMVRLAQATLLTGDEQYGAHAFACIHDWIRANPVGHGINWASSLEVAMRVISWSWVIGLLRHTPLLTEDVAAMMLASMHAHASHIHRFLSSYYSPNTHLTGEALGLFYAGALYPQFATARSWLDTGASTLMQQADRQITTDGVYFEQSACYQRYSCDIYLHFLLLAKRTGFPVPHPVRERIAGLIDFLAAISSDDGGMPDIGDADGGWLLPLARRDARDCRGTLAVASRVFNRTDAADESAPEPLWLMGIDAAPDIDRPRIDRDSRLFREGGYAILRSGDHDLIVDVGPLGCFGHGHADLLSVQCRIFGEPCLVDAGTYTYTAEPAWRDYFRGSFAHSTITIDGRSQGVPQGPFGWQARPAAHVIDWQTHTDCTFIEAEHHAYADVTHRRRVVAIAGGLFVIVDELLGGGTHDFELTFQFAPIDVALTSDTIARAITPRGHQLWVTPFSSAPLRGQIITGSTEPIRGWISEEYGRKTPAPALIYSSRSALPVRIVTVLHPQ